MIAFGIVLLVFSKLERAYVSLFVEVPVLREVSSFALVMGAWVVVACSSGNQSLSEGSGSSANGATGSAASGGGINFGTGGRSSGNAGQNGAAGFDPGTACVGTSVEGERVPVDLYFMVDTTGSMNCPVPDSATKPCTVDPGPPYSSTTRWVVESAALKSFMNAPANAGVGVGIAFFPAPSNACDAATYTKPSVEIAALPGGVSKLDAAIDAKKPAGNTPTLASLTGAVQHATDYAKAHVGHRVAVVYSTDGYPVGCASDNTIANAANVAKAAYAANPSVPTYVLGVGNNLSSLNQIAQAGGTDQAYLIDTTGDAAAQLSAALDSIRGRALVGCTYQIPPAPAGSTLDYGKVNVRVTSGSGQVTNVARDPSASACTQGWQYSADMSQINLCGDTCAQVKADPNMKLEVLFGCNTVVILK